MQAKAFSPAPRDFLPDTATVPATVVMLPVERYGLAARVGVDSYVCPAADPYSREELTRFAQFLAAEMRFSIGTAAGHTLLWYREQVSPEAWTTALCTLEGAYFLRRKTIKVCGDAHLGIPANGLGLLHYQPRMDMGLAEMAERHTFGIGTFLLAVCGILGLAILAGSK